jgi:hypothetical protein
MEARLAGFRNRYFLIRSSGSGFCEIRQPLADDRNVPARYFVRALLRLETSTRLSGFTFVIVREGWEDLPAYGEDVVVIVTSDEHYRVPVFSREVGIIFKCHGIFPPFEGLMHADLVHFLSLLRAIRSCTHYLASRARLVLKGRSSMAPIRIIPVGDRDVVNLSPPAISERRYDVSFIGSLMAATHSPLSLRGMIGTAKGRSRANMVRVLEDYARGHPERSFLVECTADFGASQRAGPTRFSEVLADTKVCVTPRGNVPETYRLFQGARFGCVLITEALPRHWYLERCPALVIRDWRELPAHLDRLLGDPRLLAQKSTDSLDWWRAVVSEQAISRYIGNEVSGSFADGTVAGMARS